MTQEYEEFLQSQTKQEALKKDEMTMMVKAFLVLVVLSLSLVPVFTKIIHPYFGLVILFIIPVAEGVRYIIKGTKN